MKGGWAGFLALLGSAVAAADTNHAWRAAEAARVRLHVERMATLAAEYLPGPGLEAALERERSEIASALVLMSAAQPPPVRRGARLEAYISAADGSPQPFWRYLPVTVTNTHPALLVFLHGYNPLMDLVAPPAIPPPIEALAEQFGVAVVGPFGRSNTDFQGIGEQDVLAVMDEMTVRYGTDPARTVLMGMSMGGLGAWCLGSRQAHRFNAILVICGRGDFYVWHQLSRAQLPGWQRELADTQFATLYLDRLIDLPVVATHGRYDDIVTFEQGAFMPAHLQRVGGRRVTFIEFPYDGHDIFAVSLMHPALIGALQEGLRTPLPRRPPPLPRPAGFTGSRLQDALLQPFIFVAGRSDDPVAAASNLHARASEWWRFAKGRPRTAMEDGISTNLAPQLNLFVFGEPETSPLISRILTAGGVTFDACSFHVGGRSVPRRGHGFWFTGRNPFNPGLAGIVQCGIPWGDEIADNHRYDRLPDLIAYGPESDRFGINIAVAAGFIDAAGRVRWADPPMTEAIRRPVYMGFEEEDVTNR